MWFDFEHFGLTGLLVCLHLRRNCYLCYWWLFDYISLLIILVEIFSRFSSIRTSLSFCCWSRLKIIISKSFGVGGSERCWWVLKKLHLDILRLHILWNERQLNHHGTNMRLTVLWSEQWRNQRRTNCGHLRNFLSAERRKSFTLVNWRKDGVGATFKRTRENKIGAILQDFHPETESHKTALEVPMTVFFEWADRVPAIGKCNRKRLRWLIWEKVKESMKQFPSFYAVEDVLRRGREICKRG